ncbi:MAG: hypothetical protein N3F04_04555 [Candidatus Nezhaarchaeota archaeon]|nr:hypothetical protein [Candidatus Nezhaarchaeota archaeon]MCX8142027.1 hypothetical protein [Candidatus Nezhaarchaeota archaeon]MDW8050192.1 hypothetical protein [Nitrososphaerota archaeon]
MTKTTTLFLITSNRIKNKGVSELIAAITLFTITLTISCISIAFIAQRTSMASKSIASDVERAILKTMSPIKLIDIVHQGSNESLILLYNPSDIEIVIDVIIIGNSSHRVNKVLKPMQIAQITISGLNSTSRDRIYVLTLEGVLIDVKE